MRFEKFLSSGAGAFPARECQPSVPVLADSGRVTPGKTACSSVFFFGVLRPLGAFLGVFSSVRDSWAASGVSGVFEAFSSLNLARIAIRLKCEPRQITAGFMR